LTIFGTTELGAALGIQNCRHASNFYLLA
jgi:hypothetical protein